MAETLLAVYILVGNINATVESHVAVDNENFSMVTVILIRGQCRFNGRKGVAMNAFGLQNLRIVVWQKGDGAHAVIHKPDFYTFCRFFL